MKKRILHSLWIIGLLVFCNIGFISDFAAQAVTPTPVIIAGQDSSEAIADSDIMVAFRSGSTNPREVAVSRLRGIMQQGIPTAVPTATEKPNPTHVPTATPQPIPTASGGTPVDLSGKLDVNLGNVRTGAGGVTAMTRADFALKADLMRRDISNLNVASGQVSNAAEWRTALGVPRIRHQVISSSTANISVQRGEEVYFTDTNRLFLALVSISISPANIIGPAGAGSFREIHEALADVAVSGEYSDLVDRPFLYVAPGAALPSPDSGNEKYLVVAGTAQGRIIYHQVLTHGSGLDVTYRAFNSSDLASGNYRGEVNYWENLPSDANNGDVYFVRSEHNLRIWNDAAVSWGNVPWTSGEWIGAFHSESAADQAVAAEYPDGGTGTPVGKHLSYGGSLSTQDLYTITAYTPAVADVRSWKPIFTNTGGGGGGTGVTEAEVDSKIATHNSATDAHADIRLAISSRVQVIGTPGDGQVIKWSETNSRWEPRDDATGSGGSGEENVQADWNVTDTTSDAFIKNKPTIITTAPGAGDGGKIPSVSAADLRYLKLTGGNVGGLSITGDVSIDGDLDVMGDMNIVAGDVPDLPASKITSGNFNPQRLANNAPDALTTDVQFLGNNTSTTARWRDLDGYVDDFAGALLATLTEFSYDSSTNTLTFQGDSPVDSDHFKGDYDSNTTYVVGDLVEHNSEFWIVANAALANANAPDNPVETTGWSQFSDRPGYRGRAPVESTLYHTGDTVAVPGEGVFLCTNGGNYTRAQIPDHISWVQFESHVPVSRASIEAAISAGGFDPSESEHSFIVHEPSPESRLEFHDEGDTRAALGLDTALLSFVVASDDEGIEFTRADGNTEELTRTQLQTVLGPTGSNFHAISSSNIAYDNGYTARIGNESSFATGDVLFYQHAPSSVGSSSNEFRVYLTGHSTYNDGSRARVKIQTETGTRNMLERDLIRYNFYALARAGSFWFFVGGTRSALGEAAYRDVGTGNDDVPELNSSGDLADSVIPSLSASKITSGSFATGRIPNLDASKITSGTFDADRIPAAPAPTVSEWRYMSGGNPADVVDARCYHTDITPDSSATFIYVSPLYESGDNHQRGASWFKILYSDWSSGDAVTATDGGAVNNGQAHEYINVGVFEADSFSDSTFDSLNVGRTSSGNLAFVFAINGTSDPDVQGIRVFTD